jgi:predicted AlkP superfamily pyrophosphatase or phosphodiesterase
MSGRSERVQHDLQNLMTYRAYLPIVLALALLGATRPQAPATPTSPAPAAPNPELAAAAASRPRLVVFISVDQMRADYLDRFRPLFTAGLKRLVEQGAVFTNAFYRHACTETGPGHSVLMSGRSPRSSGIVGNMWYDRTLRQRVNVVDDPAVRLVGSNRGRAASPAYFNAFTVGDVLKAVSPGSKVVGVSFKDRAAILPAGRRADAAYWYQAIDGRFVTSSWYADRAPGWLDAWNERRVADRYAGHVWDRLLPDPASYLRYAGEDAVQGEFDNKDIVFPHAMRGAPPSSEYYDNLRRTPFADEMLLDFALAAMKGHDLGSDDATDVLTVSFSATDVIGHTYGPDSQEEMDNLLRLDRTLGRLFDAAEKRAGAGRVLFVLSADHGSMPLVELLKARGVDARRADAAELAHPVEVALAARFPGKTGLIADADPMEYVLDQDAITRQGLKREDVEQTIRQALLSTGLVEAVYTRAELMGPRPADDPFFDRHQRAFYASRSGDLVARLRRYVYLGGFVGGTGHGTPHDYDRHVPIVFMGPGIHPGRRDVDTGPEDIAWALGRLLGLDYPQQDSVTDLVPLLR